MNTAERNLLVRLQGGDREAFELIYQEYSPRLAGNLMRLLRSEDLVKEQLQILFIKLWNNRGNIDCDKPLKGYLFKIAENLVYDVFREAARERKLYQHFVLTQVEGYSHIEEGMIHREEFLMLEDAISKLPPQRQRIFRLKKIEGKSYAEIGQLLNVSNSTINDHLTKANRFLKEYISHHDSIAILFLVFFLLGA